MSKPLILLVHGAWHGAWCWDRVRPILEAAGHAVRAPTLAGLAERHDPTAPPPGLEDHIADVLAAAEGASSIVLVGHSYGGMPITGAADRLGGRLKALVYLDAAVPTNGQDFASRVPGLSADDAERRREAFRFLAPDGAWIPSFPAATVGVSAPADVEWLSKNLTPHPLRTWLEPVALTEGGATGVPKTYVLVTDPPTDIMGYPLHGRAAKAGGEWRYREIACGHDLMVIDPQGTAELILEAAQ